MPVWPGPGRNSPNMKASCPLELPPKLLRGARMRPSNRGSILDIFFLFGSLTAAPNLKKECKKPQNRASAASPTPHSYRLRPGFTDILPPAARVKQTPSKHRARLKAIGVRGGVSWGGWVGWGVGGAAEGQFLGFLCSF